MSSQSDLKSTHPDYEIEIKGNITVVKIPENYTDKPLTEEQKEKLLQFDEEFNYRYTDNDEEYVSTVKLGSTTPPLVSSYRPFRNPKKDDRFRGEKRKWDNQREYNNQRHSNYYHNSPNKYGYNNDYRR